MCQDWLWLCNILHNAEGFQFGCGLFVKLEWCLLKTQVGDPGMVMSLSSLVDVEDRNLLAGSLLVLMEHDYNIAQVGNDTANGLCMDACTVSQHRQRTNSLQLPLSLFVRAVPADNV
jgi:hypothetical protein